MVNEDPDAEQPREELVPGWRVPSRTRYDYDVRIGDAERDATMTQLRDHFVAGRLTFDELTERIDLALGAKTQGQIESLMADLPRPAPAPPGPRRARRTACAGLRLGRGPVPGVRAAAVRAGHVDPDHGLDVPARLLRGTQSVPWSRWERLAGFTACATGR